MRFCDDHWDRLRAAVEERGMGDLIADDPDRVVTSIARELEQGEPTLATFDPLMHAHWGIANNALQILRQANPASVGYLMQGDDAPEDKVDPLRYPGANGRTWPRCPLCYLGLAHELSCNDNPRCKLPKVDGYAWMIDRAADESKTTWERLQAAEVPTCGLCGVAKGSADAACPSCGKLDRPPANA